MSRTNVRKILDTRTIIINLLKEDQKTFLSISRLQKLISYIYDSLARDNELDNYITFFDLNFDALERTVMYNNNIFKLDIEGDMIYLREEYTPNDLAEKYTADTRITNLITDFINQYAA